MGPSTGDFKSVAVVEERAFDDQALVSVLQAFRHCSKDKRLTFCSQQVSVQDYPIRCRPLLPVSFATPQPPPPNYLSLRLSQTVRCTNRSRKEEHVKLITLEGTVIPQGGVNDRAISTPKGGSVNLTFDEGVSAIFSDQGTSLVREADVLHVQPNEQQASRLRQWNVQSPLCKKKIKKI
ncbi:unnamed protein product [Pleuronectes platessa]|uniref:Uncharacterized protein n=1 Tax=Pleuronectes platessa TaxID=8262 RepID=A0A9N7W3V6_PLEPL|nr:unnamed protein product [Pleuronectes platessa]